MGARSLRAIAVAGVLTCPLLVAGPLPATAATECAAGSEERFDANGDGVNDVVVGAPAEDVDGFADTGAVTIIYGSGADADTVTYGSAGARVVSRKDVAAGAQGTGDRFGASIVTADLNADNCTDLVVGAPGAGGIPGAAEADDLFGASVTTVRAANGQATELWIGSPGEDIGTTADAGSVTRLLVGQPGEGVGDRGIWSYYQGASGVPGASEAGDRFGTALAGGQATGTNKTATVAVGTPYENIGSAVDAGSLTVFDGAAWRGASQDTTGVSGTAEAGDRFGAAVLVAPRCGDDIYHDIMVGAPGEDIGSVADAGIVVHLDPTNSSFSLVTRAFQQGSGTLTGKVEEGDQFGAALGSKRDDLLIGAPGEDISGVADAGTVTGIQGFCVSGADATPTQAFVLQQGSGSMPGTREAGDRFGASIAAVDAPGGRLTLIGSPGESDGTVSKAGAVAITRGGSGDLRVMIDQSTDTISGTSEAGDGFGATLNSAGLW